MQSGVLLVCPLQLFLASFLGRLADATAPCSHRFLPPGAHAPWVRQAFRRAFLQWNMTKAMSLPRLHMVRLFFILENSVVLFDDGT